MKNLNIKLIILSSIIISLFITPLFAESYPISTYTVLSIVIIILSVLWVYGSLFILEEEKVKIIKSPLNFLFLLICVIVFFQVIPLPPKIVNLISPEIFSDKKSICDLLVSQAVSQTGNCEKKYISISYDQYSSIIEFLKICVFIGFFCLIIHVVESKTQLIILVYSLIIIGILETLFGCNLDFWWWASFKGHSKTVRGTYIISQHYLKYMIMIIPLTFGLIYVRMKRWRVNNAIFDPLKLFKKSMTTKANPEIVFLIFCVGIMIMRLLFTSLKTGILITALTLLFGGILFYIKGPKRKIWLACIMTCFLLFYYQDLGKKNPPGQTNDEFCVFSQINNFDFSIISNYPFLGPGIGTFDYIKNRYINTSEINEWNKMACEIGIVPFLILTGIFMYFLLRLVKLWKKRNSSLSIGISTGVFTGLFGLFLHSFFQPFFITMANSIFFSAYIAAAYLSLHLRRGSRTKPFFYRTYEAALTQESRKFIFLIFTTICLILCYFISIHFMAQYYYSKEFNASTNDISIHYKEQLEKAVYLNPYNSDYYYKLAKHHMRKSDTDEAIKYLEKALVVNSTRGICWYDLGKQYTYKNKDPVALVFKWLPLAEKYFDKALSFEPNNPELLFEIASYWVWRSKMLPESKRDQGIKKFQDFFKKAITLKKDLWYLAVDKVIEYYSNNDKIVLDIIPEDHKEIKNKVLQKLIMIN